MVTYPVHYRIQRATNVATATVPAITPNESTKRQTNCRRSAFMTMGLLTEVSVIYLLPPTYVSSHAFRLREELCTPIATANQACQCDNRPLDMKKRLVQPGSAPNRQQPSAPASTASGASSTTNTRDPRITSGARERTADAGCMVDIAQPIAFVPPIAGA